ncbi:sulfatase family protein [Haloferula sp.]|uniref:sulfatase family protein n=1 Tax=Haloferula sp. TaxID=2497595 RepID=UPI00329CB875
MNLRTLIPCALIGILALPSGWAEESPKPNIVFVLCDDLGYGDIHCLNPERGKIPTPGVDRLAKEGMIFTDAHSGSAVCTPTRYGLMTGRYSWRTPHQRGVVQGFKPCLIAEGRPTVAGFLKEQGYHTSIVGKWHLDFQYADPDSGDLLKRPKGKKGKNLAPVGSKIPDGPVNRGFDYFHGFHHAGDMRGVIENDVVIAHEDEIHMLPRLTRKAVEYIDERAKKAKDEPFFLYVPYGSPHTPILPTKEWQGKSGLGAYGDFVMETDDGFKQILEALDRNGFADNTLVIFSADNGCSKAADIKGLEDQGHFPSAHLRGSKADLWDGGHRVPFVVRWPGKVEAGSTSDQLICLTDLMATCAELLDSKLPGGSAEDSVSFLPALSGKPIESTREGVIHHSISGHFGYRKGKWKLLLARGSGGWTAPKENEAKKIGSPVAQLYDLEKDPGETKNLYESQPEVAASLLAQLEEDVTSGRSTAGPESKNDTTDIKLWKSGEK